MLLTNEDKKKVGFMMHLPLLQHMMVLFMSLTVTQTAGHKIAATPSCFCNFQLAVGWLDRNGPCLRPQGNTDTPAVGHHADSFTLITGIKYPLISCSFICLFNVEERVQHVESVTRLASRDGKPVCQQQRWKPVYH